MGDVVDLVQEVPIPAVPTPVVPIRSTKRNCLLQDPRNKTSDTWKHFKLYPLSLRILNYRQYAVCIHCYAKYKEDENVPDSRWEVNIGTTLSTGKLDRHMISHHIEMHQAELLIKAADKLRNESNHRIENHLNKNQKDEDAMDAFLKWVIKDLQPLDTSEDKYFKEFIKIISPNFKLPGREKVRKSLLEKRAYVEVSIQKLFSDVDHVAITTDCWSSSELILSFLDLINLIM